MAKQLQKIELEATARQINGRAVRALRTQCFLPAVLYGKGQESISLQVPVKDFNKVLKVAGESTLIYVNVGGQAYPSIIKDVTRHPVSDSILHADFYKVNLNEKIKAKVPVVFTGESAAVKDLGGIFVRNVNELEVEAFPQNLPHEISIDISSLKAFGAQIVLKDVTAGADVKIMGEPEEIIATIQEPISEEELKASLEAPTTDISAVEKIEKEKAEEEVPEDGEAPAAPAEDKKDDAKKEDKK